MYPSKELMAVAIAIVLASSSSVCASAESGTVVVSATRQAQRISESLADITVISPEEVRQAGQTTLVELLARQPEIQSYSTGGPGKFSGIFIRGANSNHTLVFVDGVRIGAATAGTPALEQIPLAQIDHVEILRGPASAMYGADAVGGVIQIFTKRGAGKLAPEIFIGAGGYDTRNMAAGFSGGSETLSYSLHAGYDSTAGIKAISDRAKQPYSYDPSRSSDGFRNASLGGRLAFERDPGHELGATLLHTDGRNWYESGPGFDTHADVSQSAYSVYSRDRLTASWTSTVRLAESVDDSNSFGPYSPHGSRYKTTQDQLSWQSDIRTGAGSFMVVLENLQQRASAQGQYERSRSIASAQLGWGAAFGEHRLQFNLRNDDNSQFGGKTTGYAGYAYRLTSSLRAEASAGTAFHAPTFNDLYYPYYSNPNLRPETAQNKEVGLLWDADQDRAGFTVFDNRVSDLIVSSASTGYIPQNLSHASLKGASLSGESAIAGFDVKANLDYLDARNSDTNKILPRRAREQANLRIGRRLGQWTVAGELNGVGRRYDSNNETNRMGAYALANMVAHYAVNRDWTVEARANNVFDRKYETAWGYANLGANVFVGVRYAPR